MRRGVQTAAAAVGLAVLWGLADGGWWGGASYASVWLHLRYALLGWAVNAGLVLPTAAIAALTLRRHPHGAALAVGLCLPSALIALRAGQQLISAPLASPTGLAVAVGAVLPFAVLGWWLAARLDAWRARGLLWGLPLALSLAAAIAPRTQAPPTDRDVILISIDSVRADVWDAYVADHASPSLRRLLDSAVVFDDARTTWSHSLPSHASMLTGLFPVKHGARISTLDAPGTPQVGSPLLPEAQTLASRLGAAGYQTAGVVENVWLGAPYDLERGFSTFINGGTPERVGVYAPWTGLGVSSAGKLVQYVLARVHGGMHPTVAMSLDWWDHRAAGQPTFQFIHFIDMHVPHDPPAAWRERFASGPYADWGGHRLDRALRAGEIPAQDRPAVDAQLRALAMASLARMDHDLVPLLDGMTERGVFDKALVVLTADHGDNLWERVDDYGHSHVWEATARVPLLVRAPDGRGARVGDTVSLVDIAPTAYAFTEVRPPLGLDGLDLLDPTLASGRADRPLLIEGHDADGPGVHRAVVWGHDKLMVDKDGHRQLFDLSNDPTERYDVLPSHPDTAARLLAAMDAWVAQLPAQDRSISPDRLPDDVREGLQALGYVE